MESVEEPGGGFGEPATPLYDFVYDSNGNMTEREDHMASNTYTQDFDTENRLIQVSQSITDTITTFDYDDTGQRTRAVMEETDVKKRETLYPFPNYEVERRYVWNPGCTGYVCGYWDLQETITRKTYSAGGQAIATRVSGDPNTGNNGLFYFHSDHLGSATFLTHGNGHANEGLKVANSTKFYTPFGEYRIQPPSPTGDITDRGFTGHKHNDEIGLIYMNARYFLPSVGRFLSADTLIPDPANPQSFNRYSYVLNRSVNFTDPSGHLPSDGCDYEGCDLPDYMNPDTTYAVVDPESGTVILIDTSTGEMATKPTSLSQKEGNNNSSNASNILGTAFEWLVFKPFLQAHALVRDGLSGELRDEYLDNPFLTTWNRLPGALAIVAPGDIVAGVLLNAGISHEIIVFIQELISSNQSSPSHGSFDQDELFKNPNAPPGPDWQWQGDPVKGAWYNPKTDESLRPDLAHGPPQGPHWDYRDSNGKDWRLNPDGTMVPK